MLPQSCVRLPDPSPVSRSAEHATRRKRSVIVAGAGSPSIRGGSGLIPDQPLLQGPDPGAEDGEQRAGDVGVLAHLAVEVPAGEEGAGGGLEGGDVGAAGALVDE